MPKTHIFQVCDGERISTGVIVEKTIGEMIKRIREETGMSQEELGRLLGVTQAAISKYESGKTPIPKDVLVKIATLTKEDITSYLDYLPLASETVQEVTDPKAKPETIIYIVKSGMKALFAKPIAWSLLLNYNHNQFKIYEIIGDYDLLVVQKDLTEERFRKDLMNQIGLKDKTEEFQGVKIDGLSEKIERPGDSPVHTFTFISLRFIKLSSIFEKGGALREAVSTVHDSIVEKIRELINQLKGDGEGNIYFWELMQATAPFQAGHLCLEMYYRDIEILRKFVHQFGEFSNEIGVGTRTTTYLVLSEPNFSDRLPDLPFSLSEGSP